MDLNNHSLSGRMGNKPELQQGKSGVAYARFSLYVANGVDQQGNTTSSRFSVVFFGKQAEALAKYGDVGRRLNVSGRTEVRKYVDANGVPQTVVEVVGAFFAFADSAPAVAKEEAIAKHATPAPAKTATKPVTVSRKKAVVEEEIEAPFFE